MPVALPSKVKEADFRYLYQTTGLSKGNLSVHLSRLEEAGYIAIVKTFRGKYPLTTCRLTERGRGVLDNYRKILRAALSSALARMYPGMLSRSDPPTA